MINDLLLLPLAIKEMHFNHSMLSACSGYWHHMLDKGRIQPRVYLEELNFVSDLFLLLLFMHNVDNVD